jgi:hypothetical protein
VAEARSFLEAERDVTVADPRIEPATKAEYLKELDAIEKTL